MSKFSLTGFLTTTLRALVSISIYKNILCPVLILAIFFNKIVLCPFNNNINYFKSNFIAKNFYTQVVEVANSLHQFLLTNNYSPY